MMSGFEFFGLVIIALLMLSVVGIYRLATCPSGIWRESGKYRGAYLAYCARHRQHDYEWKYMAHQRAMIMWFRAPLIEEFMNRASALREYLIEHGREPSEALSIWRKLFEINPGTAAGAHVTPASMIRAYDRVANKPVAAVE